MTPNYTKKYCLFVDDDLEQCLSNMFLEYKKFNKKASMGPFLNYVQYLVSFKWTEEILPFEKKLDGLKFNFVEINEFSTDISNLCDTTK